MTHLKGVIRDIKRFKETSTKQNRVRSRILRKLYHLEAVEKRQKKRG